MYLRVTHAQFNPSRYNDVMPVAREVNTAIQQLPGCQGFYQGINRNAGTVAAVSIWDTEEHARFSRDALGDTLTRLQDLGVQLEPPRIYEMVS